MVNLGIIGFGPRWETRYLPALRAFEQRIRIRAVFDPVYHRATTIADQLSAQPTRGLHELLRRGDLRGVLVLHTGWQGLEPLRMAIAHQRPCFIAEPFTDDVESLARLHLAGLSTGLTLMPELPNRYQPATSRLLELLATQLGQPRQITVNAVLPAPSRAPNAAANRTMSAGLVDWCRHLARALPQAVQQFSTSEDCESRLHIEFRPPHSGGLKTTADLKFQMQPMPVVLHMHAEHGWAEISSQGQLQWSLRGDGAKIRCEQLEEDRSDIEVLLDLFCRRVVGGLIPVADLADVCSHLRLLDEAARTLTLAKPIRLSELN